MKTFTKETGGQAFFPRFPGEYPAVFQAIDDAMRNQYSLSYHPSNIAKDGKYRHIKVELINPETGEPLRITNEKSKPIKYQIIAKSRLQRSTRSGVGSTRRIHGRSLGVKNSIFTRFEFDRSSLTAHGSTCYVHKV